MGIQGVTLYSSDCKDITDENPLPVKIKQNDSPDDNLKSTLYDSNGNEVDLLSQEDLLYQILKQLKITNLHLSMLTDMTIDKEEIM